jgi:shikimate dehydrogenase
VGAVNTLVFEDDRIVGSNTDVLGFQKLLEEAQMAAGRVTILGAGGAARAVLAATIDVAKSVTVVSRRAEPLSFRGHSIRSMPWSALPSELAHTDLLVDATGQSLASPDAVVDVRPLAPSAQVVDLVVRKETPLTLAAKALGLKHSAGAPMLLHQGAAALSMWLGQPAPLAVMRAVLDKALG